MSGGEIELQGLSLLLSHRNILPWNFAFQTQSSLITYNQESQAQYISNHRLHSDRFLGLSCRAVAEHFSGIHRPWVQSPAPKRKGDFYLKNTRSSSAHINTEARESWGKVIGKDHGTRWGLLRTNPLCFPQVPIKITDSIYSDTTTYIVFQILVLGLVMPSQHP